VLSYSIARERTFIDRRRKYRPHTDQVGIGGLAGLFPSNGHRGRCGRYVNDFYGYISVMRANEACCQIISRG
jgi:hypothetical protein